MLYNPGKEDDIKSCANTTTHTRAPALNRTGPVVGSVSVERRAAVEVDNKPYDVLQPRLEPFVWPWLYGSLEITKKSHFFRTFQHD